MIKFTTNGYQIHVPMVNEPLTDNEDDKFEGRIPFIYHRPSRSLYMGAPNWFHDTVEDSHGISLYDDPGMYAGYIGQGGNWPVGVNWYGRGRMNVSPDEKEEIHSALGEHGYPVAGEARMPGQWEDYTDADLWED